MKRNLICKNSSFSVLIISLKPRLVHLIEYGYAIVLSICKVGVSVGDRSARRSGRRSNITSMLLGSIVPDC